MLSTAGSLALFAICAGLSLGASSALIVRIERVGARLGVTEAILGLTAAIAADAPEITSAVTSQRNATAPSPAPTPTSSAIATRNAGLAPAFLRREARERTDASPGGGEGVDTTDSATCVFIQSMHSSTYPTTLPVMTTASTDSVLTASRALLGVVAHSLAPALEEISLPQFRVLVLLSSAPGPLRSGALAEALGVHASTFSRMADRLASGGWVQRTANPESRRETLIELLPPGRRLVELVTHRRSVRIAQILDRLSARDRAAVQAGMEAFARAAGEPSVHDLATLGL